MVNKFSINFLKKKNLRYLSLGPNDSPGQHPS